MGREQRFDRKNYESHEILWVKTSSHHNANFCHVFPSLFDFNETHFQKPQVSASIFNKRHRQDLDSRCEKRYTFSLERCLLQQNCQTGSDTLQQ